MCVCVCVCVGVGGLVDGVVVDGERLDEAAVQLREEGQRPAKRARGSDQKARYSWRFYGFSSSVSFITQKGKRVR